MAGPLTTRARWTRRGLIAAVVALLIVPILAFGTPAASAAAVSELRPGESLVTGQSLSSPDGRFHLYMQTDGNLVVYGPAGQVVWASYAFSSGATLAMQTDGNLVVYASGRAIWNAGTAGNFGVSFNLQNDGNAVLYGPGLRPLWSTYGGTTGLRTGELRPGQSLGAGQSLVSVDGRYQLVLQTDGNLVVYGPARQVVWASYAFSAGATLSMQTDGNLAVYAGGRAIWDTGTAGTSGVALALQTDSNAVLYAPTGRALWSTNGGRVGGPNGSTANDYPWPNASPSSNSPLGFAYRNCTDFAAWRLNKARGGSTSDLRFRWSSLAFPSGDGNARGWRQGAVNSGYRVDDTPAPGAVAWWGTSVGASGHVAIVTSVNPDGSANIAEYNSGVSFGFGTRTVRAEKYLHIADL